MTFSRRAILGGLLSSAAGAAFAEAPLSSMRPNARTGVAAASSADVVLETSPIPRIAPRMRATLEQIVASADLDGTVGVVLTDASTGEVIEQIDGDVALPPASVTKAVTALYALDVLGGAFRFVTRLIATGPIEDGILRGDLILAGGGDPTLSADHLAELAEALKAAGVNEITGKFLCWRGALPYAEEIEPSQLDHLGYNPAVSGLNLNFNRVHFEWKRVGGNWQTTMDARTEKPSAPSKHGACAHCGSRSAGFCHEWPRQLVCCAVCVGQWRVAVDASAPACTLCWGCVSDTGAWRGCLAAVSRSDRRLARGIGDCAAPKRDAAGDFAGHAALFHEPDGRNLWAGCDTGAVSHVFEDRKLSSADDALVGGNLWH